MESGILLEEWLPVCNMQAFVEKDERTYFFYSKLLPEIDAPVYENVADDINGMRKDVGTIDAAGKNDRWQEVLFLW